MFNPYLRMLAHVPRWSIVPTIRQQSVAEHSFFVSLYVAELMHEHCSSWSDTKKLDVLRMALMHDTAEARMSDIPGPVKRAIRDEAAYKAFETSVMVELGTHFPEDHREDGALLIKAADLIDEYMFISAERAMGNAAVGRLCNQVYSRMEAALRNAGMPLCVAARVGVSAGSLEDFQPLEDNTDVSLKTDLSDEIPF